MIQRSPNTPQGILKCRDLVQLFYGLPMVANEIYSNVQIPAGSSAPILSADPRRIKYEIVLTNLGATTDLIEIGTPSALDLHQALIVGVAAGESYTIKRDFFTDLDSVCLPLSALTGTNLWVVSIRETFLTPAPVDEIPAG